MKCTWALVCAMLLSSCLSVPLPTLDLMSLNMKVVSQMSPAELELLAEGLAAEEIIRTKRSGGESSGSGDIFGQVSKKISSGISKKIGFIGSASSGATSFISSASGASKGGGGEESHGYSYDHPEEVKGKGSDFWSLKSSILSTLFQAIKAITGGVTILKGQLIKGGGAIAAAAGGLITKKGESVTNLGRKIISSAKLDQHKPVPVSAYGPPEHYLPSAYSHSAPYSGPSAPSSHYGPPSGGHAGPGLDAHKYTQHFEAGHGQPFNGYHAGVFLLKPLEGDHDVHHHHSPYDAHSSPSGPSKYEHPATQSGFVTHAFEALKGVLKKIPVGSSTKGHASPPIGLHPTGHEDTDNSLYPPPLPPSSHDSYSHDDFTPHSTYGAPEHASSDTEHHSGPGASGYGYPPGYNSFKKTSSVSRHYEHPTALHSYKLNKVQTNLQKILQDRSSENFDPSSSALDRKDTAKSKTPKKTSKLSSSDDVSEPIKSILLAEKHIQVEPPATFVLRGNKIVKLQT